MIYKTSMLRKSFLLPMLLVAVWLSGCVQEEFDTMPSTTGKGVAFSLTVPDVGIPSVSSRTMAGTGTDSKEDEVKTVDVLVFDVSQTPAVFLERVEGTGITQNWAGGDAMVNFSAVLSPTTALTCIVVVANKPLSSIASGFTKGSTTKVEVMEALTHTLTGKWPADGSTAGGYTPIPMYGEKTVTKIEPSMNPITGIGMKRMLARIDIRNSTLTSNNFTVEEVYLANYNTAGYVAPAWNTNGQVIEPMPDAPKIPGNGGKQTGESVVLPYTVGGSRTYDGEIYTFESPAAADAGDASQDGAASRKDAVCLIVKGKIGSGESTFYRVDFTKAGTATGEEVTYLPLKRNYKYIISITEASGAGYASLGEALASYTVMSNLKFRVIHYNRDKIKDVVYNGQYMLGVGEPEVNVTQYQDNNYTIDVFTDTPGGWKASVTQGGDWLKFADGAATASGVGNDDTKLALKIPYFNNDIVGDSRTATVTLTAGRLTHEIKVTQKVIDPGIIRFVDAYGNILPNGLFFPIRNPDGDDLPIEPQTVYVMFSVDRIGGFLESRVNNDYRKLIQYPASNGIIPQLEMGGDGMKMFSERVQAFTVHPNPRMSGDGTNVTDNIGWWWRWDAMYFNLYDKEHYLKTVSFPINQGELQFSLRYYPTTVNSRTYKVFLGAEQYLQLFVNNNWEIMGVEQLNVVNDDGSGLMRPDQDNDVIVGRKNADEKMYKQSLVGYDDGNGNDVVGHGYDFRLKLYPGKWKEGKSGTIRITFRNVMHTVADDLFPFYRTIDLQMVSEDKSYTTSGEPLFYLYPLRFDNRILYQTNDGGGRTYMGRKESLTKAVDVCKEIGDGWRLPNVSELLMSYVYTDALGGNANGGSDEMGQNIYGWYQNWTGDYWSSSYYTAAADSYFRLEFSSGFLGTTPVGNDNYFRCVRDNTYSGKKYPYLDVTSSGVTIVSREGGVGTDTSVLLASGETPDTSEAMNKVAPKLLIENTSGTGKSWEDAKAACVAKGDGWRLPTQREMFLLLSLGGSTVEMENQGFGSSMDWGSDFQKIDAVHWTLTGRNVDEFWLVGYTWVPERNRGEFGAWSQDKTVTWSKYRCVKSVN